MTITAKFQSICPACKTSIQKGDKIIWSAGSPAFHPACARKQVTPQKAPTVLNAEPEEKIRPLDLEPMHISVNDVRETHGVETKGLGRGGVVSKQQMGIDTKVDAYSSTKVAIKSSAEARRLFGLDWTVSARSLTADGGSIAVPTHRAIVRDDTQDVLGVVGSRYAVIQNSVLDILDAITDQAPITRGGVWDGGRRVWLQTEVTTFQTPSGPAKGNGLAATSHDGSLALTFTALGNVVVCRNTFRRNLATSPHSMTIRHTAKAKEQVEKMREALEGARTHFGEMQKEFMAWGRKKTSEADLNRLINVLMPVSEDTINDTRRKNNVDTFIKGYKDGPGAMPGTAWGLAMGTTYYQEHMRAIRSGSDRFERAYSDAGTERALQTVSLIASGK